MTDNTLIELEQLIEKYASAAYDAGRDGRPVRNEDEMAMIAEIKSRLASMQGAVVVPDTHVLVPKEPTPAMLDVAVSHALMVALSGDYGWTEYMTDVWRRMLSAAPSSLRTITAEEVERLERDAGRQWRAPGPVTADHPLECLIVLPALRQSDGDWFAHGTFVCGDDVIAWLPDTPENRAAIAQQGDAPEHQALRDRGVTCSYPACNCPVDGPATCARGLDMQSAAAQQKEEM